MKIDAGRGAICIYGELLSPRETALVQFTPQVVRLQPYQTEADRERIAEWEVHYA